MEPSLGEVLHNLLLLVKVEFAVYEAHLVLGEDVYLESFCLRLCRLCLKRKLFLGIGVAVMVNKCGTDFFVLFCVCSAFFPRANAMRWLMPKRCCSSIMTRPSAFHNTFFCISAWVPTRIGISPFATHLRSCAREMCVCSSVRQPADILEGNLRHSLPVMRPTCTPRWAK